MAGCARAGAPVSAAAAAVVTLLLTITTTHARWHDERYHGYEVHEAAPYLDYPHHQPLGKAYQRIQYHLTDSSSRRGFDEQFPPLYHGEVSLPPDYPRSVRQKRRALPQQGYAKVTANNKGEELNTPKTTLGLHGGSNVQTQKMTHEMDRNYQNKSKILEVQYRERNEQSSDGQAKNNRMEDKANRSTLSQEEYGENSIGDNQSSGQRQTMKNGVNEMDIDATEIRGQKRKQEKVSGTTMPRIHDKKTSTKSYERKTHLAGDNGSDPFITTDGKESSSDNHSSRRVGIAQTTAHTGYHTRHGYGKISDILGDFFRQPRGQTSTRDTELGGGNHFKNESDDRIMTKLNNNVTLRQKNNLSGQYPTDHETTADDGDFDTAKERPVVPQINFRFERKEPSHLQQEGKQSHYGDDGTDEKGSVRPGKRWSSYVSPPESYSHEPRNRDTAYKPINHKEPNKEKEHGPQNYYGSTGDIIYGTPTFEALNFGSFEIFRPRHDLGSGPGSAKANSPFMRAVPRSLHGDASLSGADPAQSLVAAPGHSSYEASFDTPHSYDVHGDNKVATDGVLGKISKFSGKNFALLSKKFHQKIESYQKLPISKFDDPTQRKRMSADVNNNMKNPHLFRKPIFTNENHIRLAEPAPVLMLDAQYHPKLARELDHANSGVSEQAQVRETSAGRAHDGVQDFAAHPEFGAPSISTADFDGTASSHSSQYAAPVGLLPSLHGRENLPFRQERRKGGGGGGGGGEGGKIHLLLVPEGDYKIYMPVQTSGVTSGGKQHGSTIINLADASGGRGHGSSSAGQLNKLQLLHKLLHW